MKNKYFAVFQLSAIHTLRNYKALIGLSIFLVTCLLIFSHLWKIAAAKMGAVALLPGELLWYIAFNEWVLISIPEVYEGIEQDLRSGKLAYILPRPISYLGAIFFEALGVLAVHLAILGPVCFLFTWMKVGEVPFSGGAFSISLLIGVCAGCVGIVFQMLVGLSAFWFQEVGPFSWIWDKLLFALGGLILPLALYPEWLQMIARCTPFPFILGDRSALALDYKLSTVFYLMGGLIFWGVFGAICLKLLYRRGLRILNIEG